MMGLGIGDWGLGIGKTLSLINLPHLPHLPKSLVQHDGNKPTIPNQRNPYTVFIFNF